MSVRWAQAPAFITSAILNDSKGWSKHPKGSGCLTLGARLVLGSARVFRFKPVTLVLHEGDVILAHIFHSRFRINTFPPLCSISLHATEREEHARRTWVYIIFLKAGLLYIFIHCALFQKLTGDFTKGCCCWAASPQGTFPICQQLAGSALNHSHSLALPSFLTLLSREFSDLWDIPHLDKHQTYLKGNSYGLRRTLEEHTVSFFKLNKENLLKPREFSTQWSLKDSEMSSSTMSSCPELLGSPGTKAPLDKRTLQLHCTSFWSPMETGDKGLQTPTSRCQQNGPSASKSKSWWGWAWCPRLKTRLNSNSL